MSDVIKKSLTNLEDEIPAVPVTTKPSKTPTPIEDVAQDGTGLSANTFPNLTPTPTPTTPIVGSNMTDLNNVNERFNKPVTNTETGVIASVVPDEWLPNDPNYKKDAERMADLQLKTDIESVKSSQLGARQNIDKVSQDAQENFALLKYANNQTIEKMGWTGGSYTDLKSMEQYIKATIAADMYGQMELLKYGYKTELAKAVAAKEANLAALEHQYLQEAFTNALALSQQTGVWEHPMIKNDLDNLEIAENVLAEIGSIAVDERSPEQKAEYERAQKIFNIINERYLNSDAPLSEAGITALREFFKEQNYYNDVTLTAAQIESLQIESDNANRLANQTYAANEFEAGRVVDSDGNLVVDLNSNDFEAISKYFEENPGQWAEWILNKYETTIQSKFAQFRTENPKSDIDTIEEFLEENTDLLTSVEKFAQNVGQESFTIGNKTYHVDPVESPGRELDPEDGKDGVVDTSTTYRMDDTGSLFRKIDGEETKVTSIKGRLINSGSKIYVSNESGSWITFDADDWTEDQVRELINNDKLSGLDIFTTEQLTTLSEEFVQGTEQTNYINGLNTLIDQGLMPDGTYFNINYGNGTPSLFYYMNGQVFKVKQDVENYDIAENSFDWFGAVAQSFSEDIEPVKLTTTSNYTIFGTDMVGAKDADSKQSQYVNEILKMAREGKLPEYALIDVNYGDGADYYVWRNGAFYKVDLPIEPEAGLINNKNRTPSSGIYESDFYKSFTKKK